MIIRGRMAAVFKTLIVLMSGVVVAGASPLEDYTVGRGDILTITVYRSADLQTVVRVSGDGTINMPLIGELAVSDLSPSQISALIAGKLLKQGILVAPLVNVLVTEYHSKMVSVLGAVTRPGEIVLDKPGLTVAEVLARAGANFASGGTAITIASQHPGSPTTIEHIFVADLVAGSRALVARPGDSIFVQSAPTFYIAGQVGRPGAYPIEPGLTFGQAVALGGGLTPRGSLSRIRVTRTEPGGDPKIMKPGSLSASVQSNDLITVGDRIF